MKEYKIDGIPGTFTVTKLDDEGPWRQPDSWVISVVVGTIPMSEVRNMWPDKEISITKFDDEKWLGLDFDGCVPEEKLMSEINELKRKYPKAEIDLGPCWDSDPHYSDK